MSRQERMELRLREELRPLFLSVEDESSQHHVPKGMETHFKVVAVSSTFTGLSRVQRHRLVNQLLQEEWDLGLHALSLHLWTPEEWKEIQSPPKSPGCKDGFLA